MAPRQRRMVDPDYAGQIRAGIGAKLNGQMTSSNSFKAFQTPTGGGISNKQYSELIGRQRQAEAATPGQRDRFNPQSAQGVVDNFGFGIGASGNFEVNPLALAGLLPIGRVAKVVGGAARLVGLGKAVIPTGIRLGAAAQRVQSSARRTAAAAKRAADEAAWARSQGMDAVAEGTARGGKVIRFEPGYVRNVQRGPFDEIVSDNLEPVGSASGDSYSEAMRLVRMGFAKEVLDPKSGARTWVSVDPSDLVGKGQTLLRESATAAREAAETGARAERLASTPARVIKETLKKRLENYRAASRQPGFGVKTPKPPTTVY